MTTGNIGSKELSKKPREKIKNSMSHRRILLSAVLFAVIIFTILTCLPHNLLNTTTWSSHSVSRAGAAPGQSPNDDAALMPMSYGGKNRHPNLDHLTLVASIPDEYVPTSHNGRRLIVVGDVHGMNTELGHLLDKAGYDSSRDHVVTLGDMVNKGPDSKGVVARLMAMNASAVRGNHEDGLLLALNEYNSRVAPDWHGGGSGSGGDPLHAMEMRKREKKMLKVAKTLTAGQVRWLSQLPLILEAKALRLCFVHAGLVPGVRLDRQDAWAVMNMRSLVYAQEELRRSADGAADSDAPSVDVRDLLMGQQEDEDEDDDVADASQVAATPTDDHSGERWAKAWDRYTSRRTKSARRTVMYGHDAKRGFTKSKYTVGLDSGCVKGRSLTALIVRAGTPKHKTFRYTKIGVPCGESSRGAGE
ncbi:hypothetical protein E4U41_002222 [Claviceps citrina]|nr:hypothetical protein E4U41_002222 [Claviceps citrina]